MKIITAEEAFQKFEEMRGEWQLLDVREQWEYDKVRLGGVRLIPLKELPDRVTELKPDKPTLCICAGGVRSEKAARFLEQQGFTDVTNLDGGMIGWVESGLPTASS